MESDSVIIRSTHQRTTSSLHVILGQSQGHPASVPGDSSMPLSREKMPGPQHDIRGPRSEGWFQRPLVKPTADPVSSRPPGCLGCAVYLPAGSSQDSSVFRRVTVRRMPSPPITQAGHPKPPSLQGPAGKSVPPKETLQACGPAPAHHPEEFLLEALPRGVGQPPGRSMCGAGRGSQEHGVWGVRHTHSLSHVLQEPRPVDCIHWKCAGGGGVWHCVGGDGPEKQHSTQGSSCNPSREGPQASHRQGWRALIREGLWSNREAPRPLGSPEMLVLQNPSPRPVSPGRGQVHNTGKSPLPRPASCRPLINAYSHIETTEESAFPLKKCYVIEMHFG